MDIKQLQKQASKVFFNNLKRDKIKLTDDYLLLKLTEELGEFIQSSLVHDKRCRPEKYLTENVSKKEMSKELADLLGLVLVIAQTQDIDVEEALVKKWVIREWLKK